jgi:hypothetical protein
VLENMTRLSVQDEEVAICGSQVVWACDEILKSMDAASNSEFLIGYYNIKQILEDILAQQKKFKNFSLEGSDNVNVLVDTDSARGSIINCVSLAQLNPPTIISKIPEKINSGTFNLVWKSSNQFADVKHEVNLGKKEEKQDDVEFSQVYFGDLERTSLHLEAASKSGQFLFSKERKAATAEVSEDGLTASNTVNGPVRLT